MKGDHNGGVNYVLQLTKCILQQWMLMRHYMALVEPHFGEWKRLSGGAKWHGGKKPKLV